MQKQKLLKLAKCLRGLTKAQQKHFNMSYFCLWREDGEVPKKFPKNVKSCGTAACALGWATAFFPRSKLKLCDGVICYDDNFDFAAGEKMFGISFEQSCYLFDPCAYPYRPITVYDVADRIKNLVENN